MTEDRVRELVAEARKAGLDPVEQLTRRGLILDQRTLMRLRVESLEQVINMIGDIPAHVLLREAGQPGNLAEDYRAVLLAKLDEIAGQARQKWFAQ